MSGYWITVLVGLGIMLVSMPYVHYIHHPQQTFLAAYLIFILAFILAAVVLFMLLGWLAALLNLGAGIGNTSRLVVFFALVFVPAFAFASWQARKPPWRSQPPS
jgi:hypothetical protein